MQVGYVQSFCLFKISLEIPNLFIGVQKKNILNIICSSKCVLMSFRCGILMKVSHNKQDFLPNINWKLLNDNWSKSGQSSKKILILFFIQK